MRIAVDVMSGDNAPLEIIKGAVEAAEAFEAEIVVVGDENIVSDIAVKNEIGNLLGHIVMGCEMLNDQIRQIDGFPVVLANELKHCILAHHGELEYGSPKKPALVEALCLSFADNLDAKMQTMKEIFKGIPENNLEWQGYNRLLESNIRRTSL